MASTYSTNLAIELIGTGDQAGTWGVTTNTNLGTLIEQAISGYVTQAVSTGTDTTITIPNGSTGVARNMYIELTGTGGTNTNLIVPANKKLYFVFNNTASGQVTVKVSGQTGVSVPNGKKMILVSNGTDIVNGVNYIQDFGTNSFTVTNLVATSATITNLIATTASVSDLSATVLRSSSGTITNLLATTASISDASATVLRSASATLTHLSATSASITNLALTSLTISSLNITNVTVASATVSSNLTLSAGTANGVLYLNASKVATSGSALTFDGTNFGVGTATPNTSGYGGTVVGIYGSGNNGGNIWLTSDTQTDGQRTGRIGFGTEGNTTNKETARIWSLAEGTTATNIGGQLRFNTKADGGSLAERYRITANGTSIWYVAGSEAARLNSTGLGIGTSSPSNKLHVNSGASTTAALIESTGTNVFTGLKNSGAVVYIGSDNNGSFLIQTPGSAFSTKMLVDTTGNLGIGTSSPASKLHVSNTAAATRITITDDVAAGRSGYIESNYSDALVIGTTSGVRGIRFSPDNTPRMFLDTAGNLGIGTSSPLYRLEALLGAGSGNIVRFGQSGVSNGYTITTNGTNLTHTWAVGGSESMLLNSSGNLGLGVTPSAWTNTKAFDIGSFGAVSCDTATSGVLSFAYNCYAEGASTWKYKGAGTAGLYQATDSHKWFTAGSGTAGNTISFTQAMTLDASGNLGVGTASPGARLNVSSNLEIARWTSSSATGNNYQTFVNSGGRKAYLGLASGSTDDFYVHNDASAAIIFDTANAERARITSGGYFKASNTGTYNNSTSSQHEFYQTDNANALRITNTSSAVSGAYGLYVDLTADPNATDSFFIRCYGGANQRASIRSNGGLANYQSNNVDLSDARTKNSITPVASMWDKIGALEIVTYKYNDQTHDDVNVGVIAQQVESVEPVWVDNDGFGETPEGEEPLKTVYTKDITFAAIKALQEAMARIEQLEAKVAALETK